MIAEDSIHIFQVFCKILFLGMAIHRNFVKQMKEKEKKNPKIHMVL